LYYRLTGERLEQLDKQHIDPLMSAMKARGITLAEIDKYLMARRAKERNEAAGRLHPTFQRKACGERLARSGTIGFSGAVSGLSAHFSAGSSQLIHLRSVRPEMVTTGTIRFPHFGQRVVRSMRSSRFFTPNPKLELCSIQALRPETEKFKWKLC